MQFMRARAEKIPANASVEEISKKPKRFATPGAWEEARALIHGYRHRLALGLLLMLVSRLAGLVLPWMSGYVVDDVIAEGRGDLLRDGRTMRGRGILQERVQDVFQELPVQGHELRRHLQQVLHNDNSYDHKYQDLFLLVTYLNLLLF